MITERLTDSDPEVRAKAAGDLAAAATAVAEAARAVRDRDASELLRTGQRPADVGRTIGVTRAQMVRFKPGTKPPTGAQLAADAHAVAQALDALDAITRDPAPA